MKNLRSTVDAPGIEQQQGDESHQKEHIHRLQIVQYRTGDLTPATEQQGKTAGQEGGEDTDEGENTHPQQSQPGTPTHEGLAENPAPIALAPLRRPTHSSPADRPGHIKYPPADNPTGSGNRQSR